MCIFLGEMCAFYCVSAEMQGEMGENERPLVTMCRISLVNFLCNYTCRLQFKKKGIWCVNQLQAMYVQQKFIQCY